MAFITDAIDLLVFLKYSCYLAVLWLIECITTANTAIMKS